MLLYDQTTSIGRLSLRKSAMVLKSGVSPRSHMTSKFRLLSAFNCKSSCSTKASTKRTGLSGPRLRSIGVELSIEHASKVATLPPSVAAIDVPSPKRHSFLVSDDHYSRVARMSAFIISTCLSELDLALIHRFLSEESSWARGIAVESLQKALSNSFGNFNLTLWTRRSAAAQSGAC